MSEGTHLNTIPRRVEPRKFAHHEVNLAGTVPVTELKRLAEACIAVTAVSADLAFRVEDPREKVVKGQVKADLQVQCQRCLEPADLHLVSDVNLAIVWSQDTARQIPEHLEPWIVEEDEADLYSMLEEEVLLAMPYVVYHDYPCVDAELLGAGPVDETPAAKTNNPFQVLEQLKDKPKK